MNKLLRAGFARLKKSRVFWFSMAAMLLFALIVCLNKYGDKANGCMVTLDSVFGLPYIMSGILLAVFCSLFIGTEYSDGTIRNKLVIGHKRSSIYLASFIIAAVAGLFMNLAYLAIACALGIPLLGSFSAGSETVLLLLLAGMLLTIAFAAVFSLLAMLNQNKALSAVICCVGLLAVIFLASYLYSSLNEPEFTESIMYTDSSYSVTVTDSEVNMDMVPNLRYLTGLKRTIYQFLMDFPPSGQMVQIVDMNTPNLGLLPLYSMIIILAANVGGVLIFRRKDLK